MSSTVTILQHSTNLMCKRWTQESIEPYQDGKNFKVVEKEVSGIESLAKLLRKLQPLHKSCVIRGTFIGLEQSHEKFPETPAGKTVRRNDVFEDKPVHWICVDIDEFEPILGDPIADPELCCEEAISTLPEEFHGASYYWHLSNSAGAAGKDHLLKVHLWFWLSEPRTSAELSAWSKAIDADVDPAVYRQVQAHYTADPVFDEGVVDPVPRRSGLVEGLITDEVDLQLDGIEVKQSTSESRYERQKRIQSSDPVVQILHDKEMVLGSGNHGQLFITCPFEHEHSGGGNKTSTAYYPANTGGYAKGSFKCLHSHCEDRAQHHFQLAIGYNELEDDFEDVSSNGDSDQGDLIGVEPEYKIKRRGIPEANHLMTDQANAMRITKKFGKRILVSADHWFVWDGKRWVDDEGEVYRYACKLSKIIEQEISEWEQKFTDEPTDDDAEQEMRERFIAKFKAWSARSEMKATIEAAVGLAKKLLRVDESHLDSNPRLFNCQNGTVDLSTGKLMDHDPDNLITKISPVAYNPEATCELWENTVAQVTLENEMTTRPIANFLQRWFGYCATADTREQVFVVHYGNGKNGKSTILDTVADVLGDYAGTAAPGLLLSNGKDRHPTEIADLFGRRMVTAHETAEAGTLREDFVKQATGGDKIKARYMRADFFEFNPTHKLQMLTNHKPIIRGQDEGIWRRVILVPYLARFGSIEEVIAGRATHQRDTSILEHLKGELEGVLAWLVRGAVEWYRDGLNAPDAVLAASKDYQTEQDRVNQFVAEVCEITGPDEGAPLVGEFGGLYPLYVEWCKEGGFHPMSKNRLVQELERVVPHFEKRHEKITLDSGRRKKVVKIYGLRINE